jgi:C1A family cysteine protease
MNIPIAPSKIGRAYGFRQPKVRNFAMKPVFRADPAVVLPPRFDLLAQQPPVFDQGQEGSCTANSACGEAAFLHNILNVAPNGPFSRQLLYFLERQDDGSGSTNDAGSSISESVAAMLNYGLAMEIDWPYDPAHFSMSPTPQILAEAIKNKILDAEVVPPTIADIKAAIFSGRGVMYGFTVFESFEDPSVAQTGMMLMPQTGEQILGGHANRWIGYDDEININGSIGGFRSRNSWGEGWGITGDFWMPYDFFNASYCSDLHRLVSAA